jgi:hypothetical protein
MIFMTLVIDIKTHFMIIFFRKPRDMMIKMIILVIFFKISLTPL